MGNIVTLSMVSTVESRVGFPIGPGTSSQVVDGRVSLCALHIERDQLLFVFPSKPWKKHFIM